MARLGKVDLLGLNAFGQNPGMNPIFGALIGGGVAGTTTILLRRADRPVHPEGIGFLAGLAVSAGMYAMKSTRHAALAGVVGAFFASGLAFLERVLGGSVVAPAETVSAGEEVKGLRGLGIPQVRALNGLGIPQARALNGLGIPAASAVPTSAGTIPGVAGSQLAAPGGGNPPVSLMGSPSAAAVHLLGIGGPPVHGLAASYGATLLGGGR